MSRRTFEVDSAEQFTTQCEKRSGLESAIVQGLDLSDRDLSDICVANAYFFDCSFRDHAQSFDLISRGARVFPSFERTTFNPYRTSLYDSSELLTEGWVDGGYARTTDFQIYTEFDKARRREGGLTMIEAMSQRLHDHAIDDALHEMLAAYDPRKIVAIMGGHGTGRDDPWYRAVARLTWQLTRAGFLVASGGGPGIMEAANLGAYLSNFRDIAVVDAAIDVLSKYPKFDGENEEGTPEYLQAIGNYVDTAFEVCELASYESTESDNFERFGFDSREPGVSLAIPTWFYGHEPTNLFCDNVAKYFSNGIREDTLLAVARGGVIFAPGSAGTLQEVFMDLAQNHYATFVDRSPMCFLGIDIFNGVFDLIQGFIDKRGVRDLYGDLLLLTDDGDEVLSFLERNPPREKAQKTPLYELLK